MKRKPYGKNRELYDKFHHEIISLWEEGSSRKKICNILNIPYSLVRYSTSGISKPSQNKFIIHKKKGWNKHSIRKIIINERGHQCERCKNVIWMGIPITLEIEHRNGNPCDNRKENLLLLCPNCHSLTPTWRRKRR